MSGTALKLIALLLMTVDHIAQFIPDMPVWMHWLGRISAPVFLFCLVWSMKYTKSQFRYLLRLYLAGLFMGIMDFVVNLICGNHVYAPMSNNFFTTLFLTGLCIAVIEMYREDRESGKRLALIVIIEQLVSVMICYMVSFGFGELHLEYLFGGLLPNILYTEGSFLIVVLGLLFYWYREEPKWLAGTFGITCLIYAVLVFVQGGGSWNAVLYTDYQWMMVFAIPFFLSYNREKGSGLKYLFYLFYPAHILILFLIGNHLR